MLIRFAFGISKVINVAPRVGFRSNVCSIIETCDGCDTLGFDRQLCTL